ncbi:hypothetical protein OV079_47930 [Nannocystis pusilla]|uniref:Uncharacterized protein n=1 Tax=Nannocystis pusilla TaxID=889268 RepID=A0A9X3J3D9_9BACT|nr:hypothetical protein [Nannocystis pusilla]MCY1013135.1 hypothetical protein [Nannocystis pusilla]
MLNLDGDACGDLNSGTYSLTFTIEDVLCEAAPGTNVLRLPNCTSWHNKVGTVCDPNTDEFEFSRTPSRSACATTTSRSRSWSCRWSSSSSSA